ncbi:hypothetical protein AX774_g3440 [Zancudomyces culisetae]|uniref:Uncharacterized protein n=1 Tax=Zancudomyces culisetae TaxID=1213189 RepID=A0A1R1PPY9_ZANCU|nr:hypothetical protein AX774_g3440 [Zancudomyces culisetae]|eukprot:OMH83056.1 hypothetical protein AX774_g3440 [Zancudomyces culisetae]
MQFATQSTPNQYNIYVYIRESITSVLPSRPNLYIQEPWRGCVDTVWSECPDSTDSQNDESARSTSEFTLIPTSSWSVSSPRYSQSVCLPV